MGRSRRRGRSCGAQSAGEGQWEELGVSGREKVFEIYREEMHVVIKSSSFLGSY